MIDQLLTPNLANLSAEKNHDEILEFLHGLHPAETAELLLELTPDKALTVLRILGKDSAADAFRKLPGAFQADIAGLLDRVDLAELITAMAPDDRVDLLKAIAPDRYEAVLSLVAQDERENIRQLARFAEGSAGSIMTTEYIALNMDSTVGEAIEIVRGKGAAAGPVSVLFAVDEAGKLKGSIPLADIIRAAPEKLLSGIMKARTQSVNALNAREEAVHTFSRYDLFALPVVDAEEILIGVITHDDIIAAIEQEHTQDLERFTAITGAHENIPYLHTSIWSHFRNRAGWLLILAVAGLVSGILLKSFERAFAGFMLLAFYIPMLVAAGGNAGSQSAAVVIRSFILKEIQPKDAFKVVWKEMRIALFLGLLLGALAFGQALLMAPNLRIPGTPTALDVGLAISLALIVQVIMAAMLGAVLPLGAAAMGADPALVSSQALATIADIAGLLIYFGTARLFLRI